MKQLDNFFASKWSIYLILIATAFIVLPNINRESLWIDEIYSANASLNVSSIQSMFTQYIFKDIHPPLYQIVLYYWGKIVGGGSDFAIRALSYLFTLASFTLSYFLLNRYFTKRIALLFVALSAFTPGILYYAQEARSYALMYGLSNILTIIFMIFIVNIKQNTNIQNSLLFVYLILGILVCNTHFFGYILIFSLSLILVGYSFVLHRGKTTFKIFTISFLIAIVGIVWLFILLYYGNILYKTGGNFWIKNNYLDILTGVEEMLFAEKKFIALFLILFIFIILPFQAFVAILKKYSLIFLPIFLILITSFLISLHTPVMTSRNLIIIFPLFLLFMAFLYNDLFEKKKMIIFLYILLLFMSSSYKSFTYQKEDWRSASEYIEKHFDNRKCKVPTKRHRFQYTSYYLKSKFLYLQNGPELQSTCDLIYFYGHTKNKETVKKSLAENNITVPYKILDFYKVYVVIKK